MNLIMENWKKFVNEEKLDERCQKGYKTHPTRKTKKMYGKTYRNCVKAEGLEEDKDPDSEDEEDEEELKKIRKELEGASKMHKSQADRIGDVMKEEDLNEMIPKPQFVNDMEKQAFERCLQKAAGHPAAQCDDPEMLKKATEQLAQAGQTTKESALDEKEKKEKAKKDACYHKVKARYDVWPSAYASGALVKCRKVGAANWGNKSSKKENLDLDLKEIILDEIRTFIDENGKGGLRDWFGKSKSKGGKPGWVQVVSGKPCARQPGQKTTPKCVSSAKRASMSKKERESAQRRKRDADPGQPGKSGAAKPTYVSTDKPKKKKSKKKESIDMQLNRDLLLSIIKEELSDSIMYYHITDATYDDGTIAEDLEFWDDVIEEAEYQGRKVTLNKPMQGDVKKSKVYVKNAKGNVVKVNFGDKKMKIKKSNPKRRKSFRARHNCKNPGPKWKARYWSCKAW
jgi:hypothetical protein